MNEEMKQHIDALALLLAQEGKARKILVDMSGGFVLSIDDQVLNPAALGIALESAMKGMG